MGWDSASHWTTKQVVVSEILSEYGDKVVAHKSTKSGLWCILNLTDHDTGAPMRLIVVDLLEKHGGCYSRKSISEDMGPSETDCPIEFLDMVPSPGGYADTWRERVRAAHARQAKQKQIKASVGVGSKVTLTNGWEVTVTSVRPFLGMDSNGKTWRIPARMLVGA